MTEEWRPVVGAVSQLQYEVSSFGRVRSLDGFVRWKTRWGTIGNKRHKGRLLGPDPHHTGYLQLKLGGKKIYRVHQLVAWAFLGPQPEGAVINHIDGNKTNNMPSNLEYMSSSDNVKHAYRNGLLNNNGENNGKAVLTDDLVVEVMAMPASMTHGEVASVVGCKPFHVGRIRRQEVWRHITASIV